MSDPGSEWKYSHSTEENRHGLCLHGGWSLSSDPTSFPEETAEVSVLSQFIWEEWLQSLVGPAAPGALQAMWNGWPSSLSHGP